MNSLLKRANRLLAEQVGRLLTGRPLKIAIDYTLILYHGRSKRENDEVARGKPKSGTTWFHAYATANIIHYLQARNIQFLMPAMVRGNRKGIRALIRGRASHTTLYTIRSARTRIAVTFPVHVVVTYTKGRQGKNKAVTYLHASSALRRH